MAQFYTGQAKSNGATTAKNGQTVRPVRTSPSPLQVHFMESRQQQHRIGLLLVDQE